MTTSDGKVKWSPDLHTKRLEPDCYGTVTFEGFGKEASRNAPVSTNTVQNVTVD